MSTYEARQNHPRYQVRPHTTAPDEWCVVDLSSYGLVRVGLRESVARRAAEDLNAWDRLGKKSSNK